MTTTATCPICEAPQVDGICCHSCISKFERELGDVPSIVSELEVTLSRQARIGSGDGKMGKGWAREKLPIHVGAIEAADVLANTLTTWARDVSDETWWYMPGARPPAVSAACNLLVNINIIRRHPAVVELVDEITDAIRKARHTIDRPADRIYFGACYSETPDEDGRTITCLEEIWANPAATEVTCRVCSAEWEIAERRAWLLKRAEDMLVTVPDAASYMGDVGRIRVTQAMIRGYIHRRRITYRAPVEAKRIRLGDLLAVIMDDGEKAERRGAA